MDCETLRDLVIIGKRNFKNDTFENGINETFNNYTPENRVLMHFGESINSEVYGKNYGKTQQFMWIDKEQYKWLLKNLDFDSNVEYWNDNGVVIPKNLDECGEYYSKLHGGKEYDKDAENGLVYAVFGIKWIPVMIIVSIIVALIFKGGWIVGVLLGLLSIWIIVMAAIGIKSDNKRNLAINSLIDFKNGSSKLDYLIDECLELEDTNGFSY